MMNAPPLEQTIEFAQERLRELTQEVRTFPEQPSLCTEAVEALSAAMHELGVAAEELWHQNDELVSSRSMAETERRRYQELFDSDPDGRVVTDFQGMIQEANTAMATLVGKPSESLVGKPLAVCVVQEDRSAFRTRLSELDGATAVQRWEIRLQPRHGDPIWAAVTVSPVRGRAGRLNGLRWMLRDINDFKRVEEALAESARVLRVHSRIADIFLTVAHDRMYADVLSVVLETMESHYGAFAYLDEDGAAVTLSTHREVREKCHVADRTIRLPRKTWGDADWSRAIVEKRSLCVNEPAESPEGDVAIQRVLIVPILFRGAAIGYLKVANKTTDYTNKDRECLEGLTAYIAPVLNARLQGDSLEKARKQAEEGLRQAAVELARSNEDLEQFAYVASHDLQEPLRQVTGYMHLLKQRYGAKFDVTACEFIDYAFDGATRMSQLIKDLLAYSRIGTRGQELQPTDANETIKEVLAVLQCLSDDNHAVVTHDPLPTVRADASQLAHLFQNLIANAITFRGEESPRIHVGVQPADGMWHFSVRDNGIGMEKRHFEGIFLMFHRLHTREEYPGTGIGLAICKKIVERHGGRIWVESEPGKGSTFHFTLLRGPT